MLFTVNTTKGRVQKWVWLASTHLFHRLLTAQKNTIKRLKTHSSNVHNQSSDRGRLNRIHRSVTFAFVARLRKKDTEMGKG